MITVSNLQELLLQLGFSQTGNVFSRDFPAIDAYLRVDFDAKQLIYPEDKGLIIQERQTTNFKAAENFVVFECVHRLLEKGYKPQHIELEPRWQVGHGASGGRADILVKDNSGKALLIIECKTWGKEFDNAWKDTINGKGQLFTYAHQERSTQHLCLYASGLEDGVLKYSSHIIAVRDNEDILKKKEKENPLAYAKADSAKELYQVWNHTYESDYATRGIFELDIQPYQIGKAKYTVDDLRTVTQADIQPKYHEFATILRQHNVSGRENAFDKLVNLFLCKIVDEKHNPTDLQFYWKGIAYDSYFDLIDRLQRLYRDGMREFLKEDVTYIDNQTIQDAFKFFKNDPDATREKILEYFRQQKYFTNNDFSFLDVHNEQLFYQNAAILLEIARMIQDIRLNGNQQNQFLGDMFEFFLDQGFKQTEGQFFTPMPVTRFIVLSLPIESIIAKSLKPPEVLDYACGAGHFLTEIASQMRPLVQAVKDAHIEDFYKEIYGIEKEYRLSKVAKVSAFMYNQDEINIIYADALAQHPDIRERQFNILVSNPPYSVRGFLETLSEGERSRYGLLETVDAKNYPTHNSIEAFFLERAKQVLATDGVAGIIAPSSILTNSVRTYSKTREILFESFDIVAIVELGSGTFGKTGTNTVTLFLRRKNDNPAPADHYRNRIDSWFKNDSGKDGLFQDASSLQAYCDHISIPLDDYKTLLVSVPNANLLQSEIFKNYRRSFDTSAEVSALKKQKSYQQKTQAEQQTELDARFWVYVRAIERDKLYYFVLAHNQPNEVLIVRSPQDGAEQKKFLDYEWSAAKGQEGIKYLHGSIDHLQSPLFDPVDYKNPEKISTLIRQNFNGQTFVIPPALEPYVSLARLENMLDFSRVQFDKQISLVPKTAVRASVQTKWNLTKLGDNSIVTAILNGGTPDTSNGDYWGGDILWVTLEDMKAKYIVNTVRTITQEGFDNSNATLISPNAVILSTRATIGKVAIAKVPLTTNQGFKSFVCNPLALNYEYLYYFLSQSKELLENLVPSGTKYKEINTNAIKNFAIPIPPLKLQAQIVSECEAIDVEAEKTEVEMSNALTAIQSLVDGIYTSDALLYEINSLALNVQYGLSEKMNESNVGYKIFRMNEIIRGRMVDNGAMKCADISADEFAKYRLNRGDVLFNRTNSIEHVGKTGLFDLDGDYCFASYLVRVVPDQQKVIPHFLALMMNSKTFQEEAKGKAARAINQANINATVMRNMRVPVPSLDEQRRIVAEVESCESSIAKAQAIIASASERKRAVLQKYL